MDYIYCIKRGKFQDLRLGLSAETVVRVHVSDYCFKPWGEFGLDGEERAKVNRRLLARKTNSSVRSWNRAGETPKGRLFVHGFNDGDPVYLCKSDNPIYRDESQLGWENGHYPAVGQLVMCNSGLVIHINDQEIEDLFTTREAA